MNMNVEEWRGRGQPNKRFEWWNDDYRNELKKRWCCADLKYTDLFLLTIKLDVLRNGRGRTNSGDKFMCPILYFLFISIIHSIDCERWKFHARPLFCEYYNDSLANRPLPVTAILVWFELKGQLKLRGKTLENFLRGNQILKPKLKTVYEYYTY
jgi:hypothetical protein